MSTWAIVVAAGSGTRFGGEKQFLPLGGRRLLDWSVDAASQACDGVVLVVAEKHASIELPEGADHIVVGGQSRSQSVANGLAAVPADADKVVVHDAARPCASAGLFAAVIEAVGNDVACAVPGVPVTDTIKRVTAQPGEGDNSTVVETVERTELVSVQTPQAFAADVLRRAHHIGAEASDDAALVERMGERVVVVPGEPENIKVTHPSDFDRVQRQLVPE